MHMLAAAQSGVLTLAMTNPIWVVKTRLCLQYDAVTAAGGGGGADGKRTYKGMLDAFYKIGRYEGVRGLYKGFVPGLWGVSHGAIQFMAYEELKSRYNHFKEQPIDSKLVGSTFSVVSNAVGGYLFIYAFIYHTSINLTRMYVYLAHSGVLSVLIFREPLNTYSSPPCPSLSPP